MKNIKNITVLLLIVILTSVFVGWSNNPNETPIALIKKIVKDVNYKDSEASEWELAKTGVPLKDGQEVKTGFKSLALILFTDGSGLLRVRENSIAHIYGKKEARRIDKNTFIQKGVVGFDVNKQEDEEFKFTTPTAVASIRGTAGYIGVDQDSSTTIVCERGLIEFQGTSGSKESGSVSGGGSAIIGKDGKVRKGGIDDQMNKKLRESKVEETKKIRIKTEQGTLEIEYYPEQNIK